ncbi:8913_t:CDS:2 [Ambispora leptoticha]|uniref:8913_t:CDS:1 n=1 Tax=Ambispora leptoticha TaxID=144679 RepID=A0A9N9FTH6_9GLOM|nr:8913_t:CDS:2 [Ambispora leptoticha]
MEKNNNRINCDNDNNDNYDIDYNGSDKIQGLTIIENFITVDEERELLRNIDVMPWGGLGLLPNPEMKRRTQHYGYVFSYRYRKVLENLGPLPHFLDFIIARCISQGIIDTPPNMCIVNEYNPGQGIMPHTDASYFGPTILSLSLLSPCLMTFSPVNTEEGSKNNNGCSSSSSSSCVILRESTFTINLEG